VRLKGRLRRLEAGVGWLETEGRYRQIATMMKAVEMLQQISDGLAADPARAADWKKNFPNFPVKLPPPRVAVRPALAPEPTLLNAAVPAAPQGEVVRVDVAPVVQPHPEERREAARLEGCGPAPPRRQAEPGQPTEPASPDMQIRPVFWRPRTAEDYYEDEEAAGTNGRCLTEYDPLAGEYDDEE
jgi:hypothetical protein